MFINCEFLPQLCYYQAILISLSITSFYYVVLVVRFIRLKNQTAVYICNKTAQSQSCLATVFKYSMFRKISLKSMHLIDSSGIETFKCFQFFFADKYLREK